MNTRIVTLTCALSAVACGGSETRPAQDPGSASATGAPSDSTVVATATDSSNTSAYTTAGASQTSAPPMVAGTTGGADRSANPTNRQADPTANTPPAGATPPVVDSTGSADQTKNADNTKIDERDRHGALTPMDQGNSDSDIKITAVIRRGLIGDKTLSFTAKNVKVITVGSKVTLRGPVKSGQEKATIEALAKQTAGVTEVDDQIEVKK
jgi:hyperosmotically inducible periplasmic protein